MEIRKVEEAKIIAFLLTDGGITKTHYDRPRSWRLHFTSKDEFLLQEFKENIEALFGRQNFWTNNLRIGTQIYLNNSEIAEYFLQFSPTYRTKQCNSHPICPILKNQRYGPCSKCSPIIFAEIPYPPVKIPKINRNLINVFLKYYFSVEGTVTDRIQISQRHPTLLEEIQELLQAFQIDSSLKYYPVKNNRYEWFLRIMKKDLLKYYNHINFLPVQISNSDITKSERLKNLVQA
jgi:intein/homing endonuclease